MTKTMRAALAACAVAALVALPGCWSAAVVNQALEDAATEDERAAEEVQARRYEQQQDRHGHDERGSGWGQTQDGLADAHEHLPTSDIPGSYEVPDGWAIAENHSTSQKLFYVQEGDEDAARPANVAVSVGANRYAASEHEAFRQAIVRQLSAQLVDRPSAVEGSGQTTEAGDVLYIFTIDEGSGTVTTFCYIVGEQRFCLMQATDFDDSAVARTAALEMADTFVWEG